MSDREMLIIKEEECNALKLKIIELECKINSLKLELNFYKKKTSYSYDEDELKW